VTGSSDHLLGAFALGFALGSAPGPVQLLILSETAKGGFTRGLRVMLGANGTLFVIVAALALGFSALQPGSALLRILRVVGGAFLVFVAIDELRTMRHESRGGEARRLPGGGLGPTARGIVSVIVNPGAWIFFATTASTVVAQATSDGGTGAGLMVAVAMTLGVSLADLTATAVGTGGRALVGEQGLRWVRAALACLLLVVGAIFVLQGLRG
jgi:threonine/homoserine/homoserine lactone efflux protein